MVKKLGVYRKGMREKLRILGHLAIPRLEFDIRQKFFCQSVDKPQKAGKMRESQASFVRLLYPKPKIVLLNTSLHLLQVVP